MNVKTLTECTELQVYTPDSKETKICSVCMEEIQPNQIVRVLNCGHQYHHQCIDKWFIQHKSCPYCREIFNKNNNLEINHEHDTNFKFVDITIIGGVLVSLYYVRKPNYFYSGLGFLSGLLIGIPSGVFIGFNSFYLSMISMTR